MDTSSTGHTFNGEERSIIVCEGIDGTENKDNEQIMIYSNSTTSSSSYFKPYTFFTSTTTEINSLAFKYLGDSSYTKAKYSIFIPLCSIISDFYAPEVLFPILNPTNNSFGTTTINGKKYRRSGFLYILDEDDYKVPEESQSNKEEELE